MQESQALVAAHIAGEAVVRGTVTTVSSDEILVGTTTAGADPVRCDVLRTSTDPPSFSPGDDVLVWVPRDQDGRGVVLGRIASPVHAAAPEERRLPAELVLEASERLTIRCGEGSLILREDGKILLRGVDLVSRAKRTNRVKGGSVAIN